MSWDINRWVGIGRLTKDAELSYTVTGKSVLKLIIAVGGRADKDGKSNASFFKVISWGDIGPKIAQYLVKGSLVAIDGHLEQNSFVPKGGDKKVFEVQIVADKVQMLNTKPKEKISNGEDEFYNPEENENINF